METHGRTGARVNADHETGIDELQSQGQAEKADVGDSIGVSERWHSQ